MRKVKLIVHKTYQEKLERAAQGKYLSLDGSVNNEKRGQISAPQIHNKPVFLKYHKQL